MMIDYFNYGIYYVCDEKYAEYADSGYGCGDGSSDGEGSTFSGLYGYGYGYGSSDGEGIYRLSVYGYGSAGGYGSADGCGFADEDWNGSLICI